MDISIVILNYKSKGYTLNCIKSIKEADFEVDGRKLRYEIIVVDNNSNESIGEILSWQYNDVIFIQNDKNSGMGRGNNIGIKKAQGDFVVVMNPDTIALRDTFTSLYRYMKSNPDVGVIGPKQLNPDKTIQASCFRKHKMMTPVYRRTPLGKLWFAQKELKRFLMDDFECKNEGEVDWLLGSFLFCRGDVLKKLGGFDERFFMYFEDTDLCLRFKEAGYKVVYYPKVEIIHNHIRQSAQIAWYKFFINKATRWHIVSWVKYMAKWGIG